MKIKQAGLMRLLSPFLPLFQSLDVGGAGGNESTAGSLEVAKVEEKLRLEGFRVPLLTGIFRNAPPFVQ